MLLYLSRKAKPPSSREERFRYCLSAVGLAYWLVMTALAAGAQAGNHPRLESWQVVPTPTAIELQFRFSAPLANEPEKVPSSSGRFVVKGGFLVPPSAPSVFEVARGAVAALQWRALQPDPPVTQLSVLLNSPVSCQLRTAEERRLLIIEVPSPTSPPPQALPTPVSPAEATRPPGKAMPRKEEEWPQIGVPFGPPVELVVGQSVVIEVPGKLATAEIANPETADITIAPTEADSTRHLIVNGMGEGVTTLHIWYHSRLDDEERVVGHRVEVRSPEPKVTQAAAPVSPPSPPAPAVTAEMVETALREVGIEGVRVMMIQQESGTSVILYGTLQRAEDQERTQQVAEAFFPQAKESIKNLLQVEAAPSPPQPPSSPEWDPQVVKLEIEQTLTRAGLQGVEVKVVERIGGGWSLLLLGEVDAAETGQQAEQIAEAFFNDPAQVQVLSLLHVCSPAPVAPPQPETTVREPSPEERLAQQVTAAIGMNGVHARVPGTMVVLEGEVERETHRQAAERIAADVAHLPVENLIRVTRTPQIATQVTVIEIAEDTLKELGLDWGAVLPGREIDSGTLIIGEHEEMPGSTFKRQDAIGFKLEALEQEGRVKILQQPTVVADSGGKAQVNIGGEVPIPKAEVGLVGAVAQTVEWRPFGVILELTPTLKSNGDILVEVSAEITELDYQTAVEIMGSTIPGTKRRSVETSAHLASGQTMVIGGLLAERETTRLSGIPLLRDLPILGELFQTRRKDRNRTMLVFFLTPKLLEPRT